MSRVETNATHDAREIETEPESTRPPYAEGLTDNLPDLGEMFPDPPVRRSLSEEKQELLRDASSLAYTAIRFCPELRDKLSGDEWDAKAATYGWLVVELLKNLIDEDLTAIEGSND